MKVFKKEEKKETASYAVTYSVIPPSKEWKKMSKKFLVSEIIILMVFATDTFIAQHVNNIGVYKEVAEILEPSIMLFFLINYSNFCLEAKKYEYEMNEKEILLFFCVPQLIYFSYFVIFMANHILFSHP